VIHRVVNGVAGWIQPPFSRKDERKLRDGSDGACYAVNTEASPWLLATEYFTVRDGFAYADDASASYILTEDEPCCGLHQIQGQFFAIVREVPGQLSLYNSNGRRYRMAGGARSWRSRDLTPAMEAAGIRGRGLRPVLRGVAGEFRRIILVVELYTEPGYQGKRLAAAVLTSEDDCETFRVRAWSTEENCDYCGVGLISDLS
jgi:hypothetical protein